MLTCSVDTVQESKEYKSPKKKQSYKKKNRPASLSNQCDTQHFSQLNRLPSDVKNEVSCFPKRLVIRLPYKIKTYV